MGEPTVAEVMTRQVITAVSDTPFKELAGAMLAHGIDVLPVIDIDGRPLGVVSEADVMTKLEFHGGADPAPVLASPRCRARWYKSLTLHSAVQRAGYAAHHVPGVVAVHNNLRYDIDDLMITGL